MLRWVLLTPLLAAAQPVGCTEAGFAVGGGMEFRRDRLPISTELRYSRFGEIHCAACSQVSTHFPALDPLVVMLGIGF